MNPLFLFYSLLTLVCIGFVCGVFGVVWKHFLTNDGQLLHKLKPTTQDTFLGKMLNCAYCVAGWSSMGLMFCYRFAVASWGLAIGFDSLCNLIVYIFVQIVLSAVLIALCGAFGVWCAYITESRL